MTCIVGLKTDKGVWIGADRACSWGGHVEPLAAPKIARFDDRMLVGFAGAVRAIQVLQHNARLPRRHVGDDLIGWMVTAVVPTWHRSLIAAKAMKENDGLSYAEFGALVAIDGRLLSVSAAGAVVEVASEFAAEGSGGTYAYGALHATAGAVLKPRRRLRLALEAAAAYDAGVGGPFDIEFIASGADREPARRAK